MDVPDLLRRARAEAGLTQRDVAARSGLSRTALGLYETGARSPSVQQLERALAACRVQLRVALEPLLADLDAALDEALRRPAPGEDDLRGLLRFAAALDRAGVPWVVDGESALSLQGLVLPTSCPRVALVDGEPARSWLEAVAARGENRWGELRRVEWGSVSLAEAQAALRPDTLCAWGPVRLRLLEARPPSVRVAVGDRVLPVLTLLEAEQDFPQLRDLLERYRQRQRRPAPAGGSGADAPQP